MGCACGDRRGITSSGPEEDGRQDPGQQQQQQNPQQGACDAGDQALQLAFGPGWGAGALCGQLQDSLCRGNRTGVGAGDPGPCPLPVLDLH